MDSTDALNNMIARAKAKAEQDVENTRQTQKQAHKRAKEIVASVFEEAADIAYSGIENGLDVNACQQISSALRLQAAFIRGDINE